MDHSKNKVYINTGNVDVLRHVSTDRSHILDVGCGGGSLAAVLKSLGHQVDGITISEEEKRSAVEHCREVFIHNLENGLPQSVLGRKYDYVICSHVLEHIVYPKSLLKDIGGILKPGGRLIIALPNLMHYKSRLKLLAGNFEYKQAGIWDYTHVKWYTFKTAQQLLRETGFKIKTAEVTGELPFNSFFFKNSPAIIQKKNIRRSCQYL
jgi:methionine biosynthesis protein MetW